METKCSGLSGRRKTHVHPTETVPTELGVASGRSRAFSSVPAFGKVHLGFRRRRRREDLHLEGRCQHSARAIAARVSSKNPARADGRTGHSVASASCPPGTPTRLMASTARLQGWSHQWTTRPGSGRRCYTSSAWEVPCSWADEVFFSSQLRLRPR